MKSFLSILVLLLVIVLEGHAQTWAEGDIQVSRKLSTAGFAPAELTFGSGLNVAYDGTSKTITVTTSGSGVGTVTSFAFTNSTGITGTVTNATTTPTLALSLTSAAVGLGNVENTALSTWAGSSALTTLGSNAARDNLTGGSGTLNLSAFTLTLPSDVTRLGSSIDLSGAEVTGSLPWGSVSGAPSFITGASPTITTPTISGAITFPDGVRQTFNPDGTNAGLNVGAHTADPSSPSNGDLVYNSTSNALRARINGAWVSLGSGGGGGTPGGSDTHVQFNDGGVFGGQSQFVYYKGANTLELVEGVFNASSTAALDETQIGVAFRYDYINFAWIDGTSTSRSGTLTAPVTVQDTLAWTMPSVSGTILTTTGNGSALTNLNASNLSSGTVPTARLGTGTANSTTYLRGDGTWATVSGSGTVTSVGGTGTVNGLTLTGTVTTSGNLTLGGTLSGVSLTTAVTGTLPAANGGTGITALGAGVATALGQNVTGSGSIVLGTSPTLTTPALGTPSAVVLTNATGTAASLTAGEATAALGLKTATTTVSVSGATAPTSGQVLTATSSTAATWQTPGGGGGTPGGSDTQVQFNDGGSFGGDAGLTYNKTTDTLTAGTFSGSGASLTTLNASNLSSGTVASARLPNPQTSAIGGVMRNTGSAGQFVSGIASNGELQYGSPAGGLANITETLNTGSPNITVNAEQLAVTGGTTNVNLVLTPRGTGGFMLGAPPDGTATGGNIIGTRAVDLQLTHGAAANVASGADAFAVGARNRASGTSATVMGSDNVASAGYTTAGGYFSTASATYGTAFGFVATASGTSSFAGGTYTTASGASSTAFGEFSTAAGYAGFGQGYYAAARLGGMQAMSGFGSWGVGGSQAIRFPMTIVTSNATPTELFGSWNQADRYTIPSGNTHFVEIRITAASTTNTASYARQVCIRNTAGTTAIVGSVQTIGTDQETDAAWDVTVEANDTNDALRILVTGSASTTIRWLALIDGIELKNP